MGNLGKNSLKRKFRNSFIKMVLVSLVASILTIGVWFFLFQYYRFPANHYETQISDIVGLVKGLDHIGDSSNMDVLNSNIPSTGIKYQVYDGDGQVLYGNTDEILVDGKNQLIGNLNKHISKDHNIFVYLVPKLDENSNIEGIVALEYALNPSVRIKSKFFDLFSNVIIFFPFVYIIIFSIYYSKKIYGEINYPIDLLMEASEKIRMQDLDFDIDYKEDNELGRLLIAFQEMKDSLKSSLEHQWYLENLRKENFAAIAHDLKTPLTIVKTYSERLLENEYDEKTLSYLMTIFKNNERSISLLKGINQLSSIESDSFSLNVTSVNLLEEVRSKLDELKVLGEENQIHVETHLEILSEIQFVNCDFLKINQVIDNIFANGLRYSTGYINIGLSLEDDGFKMSFENSSDELLSEDILKNAFEKFYKGDKSRSFDAGNSGLGLYISKRIVEKHKGSISISQTQLGSKLEFSIKYL